MRPARPGTAIFRRGARLGPARRLLRRAGGPLLEALPAALAERDGHGVVERLSGLGLLPLCAQNVEHMLCEWRKMALPDGRRARGEPSAGYAELWRAVAPVIAWRAAL